MSLALQAYRPFATGLTNSYSQIFFSKKPAFALLVMAVSFMDPKVGLAGLLGVVLTNLFAWILGFDRNSIAAGLFGFNTLFVCLALGYTYNFNFQFVAVVAVASLLTLLLTIGISAVLGKYGLPFLSLPFLFAFWLIIFAVRNYQAMELAEGNIYFLNDLYDIGGNRLVNFYQWLESLPVPAFIATYLKSLGAIVFQSNMLAGLLLAIGLLLHSRISFLLSIIGYLAGYLFYYWVEGNLAEIHYSLIGFNFILCAIAIGGFYFLPTYKILGFVLAITPMIAIIIGASAAMLAPFQLPVYSLPFAIVVLLILYTSSFSYKYSLFQRPTTPQNTPEKNLYFHLNANRRFAKNTWVNIFLPYFGEWKISQGHNGKHTHKEDWKEAWDFVVADENGITYAEAGTELTDYYGYNLPVLAPADGWVVEVRDIVEDNPVGGVNISENWGNSLVIKHGEHLFSQLSHLKKGSFKVKVGDYVKKGDPLAALGNSGRSPEPHIHFQLQSTPFVGSKTLRYPLAHYIRKQDNKYELVAFDYPKEGETISNVRSTQALTSAFEFVPGKRLCFKVRDGKSNYDLQWEVVTNAQNQSYLWCKRTNSTAFFFNDGIQHCFTSFYGDKKSELYMFYLSAYKFLLGYYPKLELEEELPLNALEKGIPLVFQDFVAPFYRFSKARATLSFRSADDEIRPREVIAETKLEQIRFGNKKTRLQTRFEFRENRIDRIEFRIGVRVIELEWNECADPHKA